MKFANRYRNWIYIFILAVSVIVVYKVIDHLDFIVSGFNILLKALKPFIIGFVIAYLLNQPCNSIARICKQSKIKFVEKHSLGIGVLTVYLIILVLVALVMSLILPALYKNIVDLVNNLPVYAYEAIDFINDTQESLGIKLINTDSFSVSNTIAYFVKEIDLAQFGKYAEGVISATSGVINIFIAAIVSVYMCLDKKRISNTFKRIMTIIFIKKRSDGIFGYIGKINDIFSKYIYCKILESLVMILLSTFVLSIFRIRYALILGIMIGVFNLIPYFGSIIATIIAVIITIFSTGLFPALWTGIILLILEQIDGNFIGPKIIGNMLDIRPLWVIFSVTIGGSLFGIVGLLLSVPVMIVIKMLFKDLLELRERQLINKKTLKQNTNLEEKGT